MRSKSELDQNKSLGERDFSDVKEDEVNEDEDHKDNDHVLPTAVKYVNDDEDQQRP